MIETLPIGEQRTVLTRAAALVPGGSGPRRNEARRMISAMLADLERTPSEPSARGGRLLAADQRHLTKVQL
jgi:hypothetical protein